MRRAVKRCSKRSRTLCARDMREAVDGADRAFLVLDDEARDAVLDDLRHGPAIVSDHRAAAGHRLDHHETERLRPVDRDKQRDRTAQERSLVLVADLADVFDIARPIEQRLDLLVVVVAIRPVDLRGDLERHAAMLRDVDRAIDPLLRRDAPEKREVGWRDRAAASASFREDRDGRCESSSPAAAAAAANWKSRSPARRKTCRTPADAPAGRGVRAAW